MLSDAFGAGVARAELSAGTSHAAHAAVSAAARKHRAAAATDASVGVGAHRRQRKQQPRLFQMATDPKSRIRGHSYRSATKRPGPDHRSRTATQTRK